MSQKICSVCNSPNANFVCGGCKNLSYCSRECQRKGWGIHKNQCEGAEPKSAEDSICGVVFFCEGGASVDYVCDRQICNQILTQVNSLLSMGLSSMTLSCGLREFSRDDTTRKIFADGKDICKFANANDTTIFLYPDARSANKDRISDGKLKKLMFCGTRGNIIRDMPEAFLL